MIPVHSMRRFSAASLAAIIPAVASAQLARDTAHVAPMVVTATRSPLATSHSPATISVLSGDELRRAGITTALDALRQVPGLTVVQSGSYGGATSLFIRGGESKFAKVLVDGVPVNDAGGAFDFSTLSTDNLDRIEIVRGPDSVLDGSDAMAGVVQLFTRRGAGATHIDASARGGGYSSYDADLAARGATQSIDYSVAGARHRTQGTAPFNSGFNQSVGSASLGFWRESGDVRVAARYTDDNVHFPTNGSGEPVDSNAARRDDHLSLGLDAGLRLASTTDLRLSLASSSVHAITDDQPDSPGDTQGYYYTTGDRSWRRSAELRLHVATPGLLDAAVGTAFEQQWQTSATQSNFGPSGYSATRRNRGVFGQLLIAGAHPVTATIGGRLDHNEAFGNFFTWRAAASVTPATDTRIHASYGTAFREPTMLENFGGGFVIGNPALAPEQARSMDLGIEQPIAGLGSVSATVFANTFTNLIDYKYSATAANYFNVARTRTSGIELEGHAALTDAMRADLAYTWLDAKVVDPGTSSAATALFAPGARLLRRPAHSLDAGVAYRPGRSSLEVRFHREGQREDVYFAPDFSASRVTLPAFVRTDLSAEQPLYADHGRAASLTLRVENLFDVRYAELAGFNYDFARTDDASLRRTGYRAPGRRILAGLRIAM